MSMAWAMQETSAHMSFENEQVKQTNDFQNIENLFQKTSFLYYKSRALLLFILL